MIKTIIATKEHEKKRLDIYVCEQMDTYTRSFVKNLIEQGAVLLNGKKVKAGTPIKENDTIEITLSQPKQIDLAPQNIPLDIVYEDNDLLVINKQAGLVVHPGGGSYSGTLVNALLFHVKDLSGINGEIRPGIVHRLDKDTSGLMLVAKNDLAHISLSKQIAQKTCVRKYLAICDGVMAFNEKLVTTFIGRHPRNRKMMAVLDNGRVAITLITVLKCFQHHTLVECTLSTGRTHQIRVHCKHIGHPVTNDELYGTPNKHVSALGQLLHSHSISFVHPKSQEQLSFTAPPPPEFAAFLSKIEIES